MKDIPAPIWPPVHNCRILQMVPNVSYVSGKRQPSKEKGERRKEKGVRRERKKEDRERRERKIKYRVERVILHYTVVRKDLTKLFRQP